MQSAGCPSPTPLFMVTDTPTPIPCDTNTPPPIIVSSTASPAATTLHQANVARIVFNDSSRNLLLADGRGGASILLSNATQAAWSPDGTQLAYNSWVYSPAQGNSNPDGIWIVTVAANGTLASTPRQIVSETTARKPSWSPDGHYLSYTVSTGAFIDLWLIDTRISNAVGSLILSGAHLCSRVLDQNWSYSSADILEPSFVADTVPDFDGAGMPYRITFATFSYDAADIWNENMHAESAIWVYGFRPGNGSTNFQCEDTTVAHPPTPSATPTPSTSNRLLALKVSDHGVYGTSSRFEFETYSRPVFSQTAGDSEVVYVVRNYNYIQCYDGCGGEWGFLISDPGSSYVFPVYDYGIYAYPTSAGGWNPAWSPPSVQRAELLTIISYSAYPDPGMLFRPEILWTELGVLNVITNGSTGAYYDPAWGLLPGWIAPTATTTLTPSQTLTPSNTPTVTPTPTLVPHNLIVTNTNDSGAGSLRAAIDTANQTSGGVNNITFAAGVSGTIQLLSQLIIQTNVVIQGPGDSTLTVSLPTNLFAPVFKIVAGATATLSDLTIQGGNDAIDNYGTLVLQRVTISGSSGWGVSAGASLDVENSTIINNTGSGIFASIGSFDVIVNSTIAGNSTGIYSSASLSIFNSTITQNTSNGIWASAGSLALGSSIVAQNSNGNDLIGNVISQGYNVIGDADSAGGLSVITHDQVGTYGAQIDALLAPLADNGGPNFTMALTNGSPAIQAGICIGNTTDQRGIARRNPCDVGAFESSLSAPPTITPTPSATPTATLTPFILPTGGMCYYSASNSGIAGAATPCPTLPPPTPTPIPPLDHVSWTNLRLLSSDDMLKAVMFWTTYLDKSSDTFYSSQDVSRNDLPEYDRTSISHMSFLGTGTDYCNNFQNLVEKPANWGNHALPITKIWQIQHCYDYRYLNARNCSGGEAGREKGMTLEGAGERFESGEAVFAGSGQVATQGAKSLSTG